MAKNIRLKKAPTGSAAVDALMDGLDHPYKQSVQRIRTLILSLKSDIKEEVKWNAPSFFIKDHFATFRLHPANTFQLILHTGAKVKANPKQFEIADPHKLLTWPAKDRCVLALKTAEAVDANFDAISSIIKAWIQQLEDDES
jgi:hypothetical protein